MKKIKNTLVFALLLASIICFAACSGEKKLPIFGEREAKITKDANGNEQVDTVYQTIPSFAFLNQDSILITQDAFKDKIYIADFFFTTCSSICPVMHRNLKSIFDQYKDQSDIMILSHTIDFKYDKPSVLKRYAQKLGVDGKKWQFVYGSKDSIYHIAEHNYLVAVGEDSTNRDGYIHQGWLVLIDKDKRIRGAYDGTKDKEVEQLKKDVAILMDEYKK